MLNEPQSLRECYGFLTDLEFFFLKFGYAQYVLYLRVHAFVFITSHLQ
jgi:hypothetical protein